MSIAFTWIFVGAFIALLLASRSPIAIFLAIASGIVPTLNRFVWWTLAHVSEKVLKFKPTRIVYGDTATTIVGPARIVRVRAAIFHALPTSVCWRAAPNSTMSVDCRCGFSPTPAGLGIATSNVLSIGDGLITAIAYASGFRLLRMRSWDYLKHGQEVEFLPNHERSANINPRGWQEAMARIEALEARS